MKKSLIALALVGAFAAPAFAEEAAAPAAETPALTGNMTVASSYRFRGIDQTFGKPAIQGGIDYSHAATGLYIGNWNSTVSSGAGFPEGNIEMDFYGGWKTTFAEDFGIDVGALYYYYPGSSSRPLSGSNAKHPSASVSGTVDNLELYVAGSWKFLTVKYSYAVKNYFDLPESSGTSYLELNGNYDLGNGWGVNGHVGHLFAKDYKYAFTAGSDSIDYTDWKLGVTKDLSGWVLGLAYVGTNAKGTCGKAEFYCFTNSLNESGSTGSKAKDAGRGIAVLSVTKTF
ncbi:MAG TPA: TorF family putative porin [Azonexus sp.]|nr:TorF family putative porin [Azonexus sp.]